MSGPSPGGPGPDALTDPEALTAADHYGVVAAVASAGAQVRAVAEQLAELRTDRPRSVLLVGADAAAEAGLAAALLPQAPVPLLGCPELPAWAGALDLVLVLAADPDDRPAAQAAAEATRRGATLLVRAAAHGPVADAAGAALVPPRVAVPELAAGPGRTSFVLAAAAAAGLAGPAGFRVADLAAVADALDAEALACGPAAEPFVNPALTLAGAAWERTTVFLGADGVGRAMAERAARSMTLLGGMPSAAAHVERVLAGGQLGARMAAPEDPFADPDLDGPATARPLPVLIPPLRRDDEAADARVQAVRRMLPRAMVLAPDQAGPEPVTAVAGALQMALRVDFAAAYLGIAAGQAPPPDGPDGLGPAGGARQARPAATVEDVMRDNWDDQDRRPWS